MTQLSRKSLLMTAFAVAMGFSTPVFAEAAKPLNDLEIAHSAYTADAIDIAYGNIALKKSHNPEVRKFAKLMVQDHTAVNKGAGELLAKLGVKPVDNDFSKALNKGAAAKTAEFSKLNGKAFDLAYAQNELAYHQAVNATVAGWIPTIQTPELKSFLENALVTFKAHENHAANMVKNLQAAK